MSTNKKYQPRTKEELEVLCDDLSINLGDIDTSLITDMSLLFSHSKRANEQFEGIETWDVSKVTNMREMFSYAYEFNRPIGNWDVSNVKDMVEMFVYAKSFNQPLDSWDTSKVEDMRLMFCYASSFNQPINSWNVGKVEDMSEMFSMAISFNQPLDRWDVGNVKSMWDMFNGAKSFNQPLNSWNVSHVKDMSCMFNGAKSFNQPLGNWNVCRVEDMSCMFNGAKSFNQPLNSWDVSNVKYMVSMFSMAKSFNQALDKWDVSNVRDMDYMFYRAKSFNQPLNSWNVSHVENMRAMFLGASSFNQSMDAWYLKYLRGAYYFFGRNISFYEQGLKEALGDDPLYKLSFDAKQGEYALTRDGEVCHINSCDVIKRDFDIAIRDAKESLEERFEGFKKQEQYLEQIKTNASKAIDLAEDTTTTKKYQPKTRDELKALCDDLSVHLGDIDTSLITDMNSLFLCSERELEDFAGIEDWDISKVKNMNQMFSYSCFSGSIEKWAEKASELEMAYQFFGCEMPHITEELSRMIKILGLDNYFYFYFDENVCSYYLKPNKVNRSFELSELLLVKGEYAEAFTESVGEAIVLMSKEECNLAFS